MGDGIKVGEKVPDFSATTDTGEEIRLYSLLENGPVVIFSYPAAMTPGCTAQSCHFRDLRSEFEKRGATVIGLSSDSVERQAEFSKKHGFGFPLIPDSDGQVGRILGVKRRLAPWYRRSTFVIDTDGVLVESLRDEMNMEIHADRALEILDTLEGADGNGNK